MTRRLTRALGTGFGLALGQIFAQFLTFVRNVIVLRAISKEDAGIGAILGLAIYLLEMLSELGSENLLIQARDGDDPRFQGTAHLLRLVRGILNAAILVLLAGPLASLFGIPDAAWAFRCLAIAPLLRGFQNLDTYRVQRHLQFTPGILVDIVAQVLPTLIAWPIAHWLHDYSALVWLLLIQVVTQVVASHWVAQRRFSLAWDRGFSRRIAAFGWPLLINGVLMFSILEGDKFVISTAPRLSPRASYTLADIGVYNLAFLLTLMPTLLVAKVGTSILLPTQSRLAANRAAFAGLVPRVSRTICLAAMMIAVPLIVGGGFVVSLVYGSKFRDAAGVIGWFAAMQAVRIVRIGPTLSAMARGDTVNAMAANLARTLALPATLVLALMGADLVSIAATGVAGELLALTTSCFLLRHKFGDRVMDYLGPAMVIGGAIVVAALLPKVGLDGSGLLTSVGLAMLVMAGTSLVLGGLRASFWREIHGLLTCSEFAAVSLGAVEERSPALGLVTAMPDELEHGIDGTARPGGRTAP